MQTGVDRIVENLGGTPEKNKTGVDKILEILESGGGGGGSSLPEVTSADEGKVLAVNASGEWAATMPNDFIVRVDFAEGSFVSATSIYMADVDYLKDKIDNHLPIIGYVYSVDSDTPDTATIQPSVIQGIKEIDGDDVYYDIGLYSTVNFTNVFHFGYSLDTLTWWVD